jgi:hypothetical protein
MPEREILARNDLCFTVARRMWFRLCAMNGAHGKASLMERVVECHPELDRARVAKLVLAISKSKN